MDAIQRKFFLWMLGGLLLRLLIMPFFGHADFLSEYRRVYMTIETGMFFPGMGRLVVYYIELIFMILCLPFLPYAHTAFYFSDLANSTAGLPDYFLFVSDPGVFRILFLLKIPYLLFDLATAVLIFRMLAGRKQQFLALALWLLNPITLYAFYFFGRFESIPIFFLALCLRMVQKERFILASLSLGLAINCREINIIFVPIFLLALIDFRLSWQKIVKRLTASAFLLFGLFALPKVISRVFHLIPLFQAETVLETNRAQHILDFRVHWLLPFVFAYTLICIWLIENRRDCFDRLATAAGVCIVAFLFCTDHSAHYVSWMVLFPVTMLYFGRDLLKPFLLLCCAWMGLWMFATDIGVFTLFLASPLSMNFSGLRTLPQWYAEGWGDKTVFDLETVILIFNNLYHAALAYLCYKFFSKNSAKI